MSQFSSTSVLVFEKKLKVIICFKTNEVSSCYPKWHGHFHEKKCIPNVPLSDKAATTKQRP